LAWLVKPGTWVYHCAPSPPLSRTTDLCRLWTGQTPHQASGGTFFKL
jgi:hypothetical protein